MKTLFIDCNMGAAGDMLTAALLELLPDRQAFLERLNALGIPGVEFRTEPAVKCGITGTKMHVLVHGEEEGEEDSHHGHHHDGECACEHHHEHEHHHDHAHEHHHDHAHEHHHDHEHAHHHHTGMHEIEHILSHLALPEAVAENVKKVYGCIAEAESFVHGRPVDQIHFHEVGNLDAIADVTAFCLLMQEIGADRVVVSPIRVGSGQVKCAHGILPVPAPATARILVGMPVYAGDIPGEMCTPTGAALLKAFADSYGTMPPMTMEAVGYGMGHRDFPAANCVRAILGESI